MKTLMFDYVISGKNTSEITLMSVLGSDSTVHQRSHKALQSHWQSQTLTLNCSPSSQTKASCHDSMCHWWNIYHERKVSQSCHWKLAFSLWSMLLKHTVSYSHQYRSTDFNAIIPHFRFSSNSRLTGGRRSKCSTPICSSPHWKWPYKHGQR